MSLHSISLQAWHLHGRFSQAILGLVITLAPLALLAVMQFLFAPQIVTVTWGLEPEDESWAVPLFRNNLLGLYASVAIIGLIYWLLTAALSRGAFLRVLSANVTLALSVLSFSLALVLASVVPGHTPTFAPVCSLLGISQTDWPFGFDTQSSCERFSWVASGIMAIVLPALLLAASAAIRILVSRRRWRSQPPNRPRRTFGPCPLSTPVRDQPTESSAT